MRYTATADASLLAPCGLDCLLCHHHCKSDEPCEGCRGGRGKSAHCRACELLACVQGRGLRYCAECPEWPCGQLTDFNAMYLRRYGHAFLPNAESMRAGGEAAALALRAGWMCPDCGGIVCIHDDTCTECGRKRIDT